MLFEFARKDLKNRYAHENGKKLEKSLHKFELLNCRVHRPSALSAAVADAAVDFDLESSQQRGLPLPSLSSYP